MAPPGFDLVTSNLIGTILQMAYPTRSVTNVTSKLNKAACRSRYLGAPEPVGYKSVLFIIEGFQI